MRLLREGLVARHLGLWVAFVVAVLFTAMAENSFVHGQIITAQSGPIDVIDSGPPTLLTESDFDLTDPSTQVPVYMKVAASPTNQIGQTSAIIADELTVNFVTSPPSSTASPHGSLIDFESAAGPLSVTENGDFQINWTTDTVPGSIDDLGVGAISAIGLPMDNTVEKNVGADVYVEHSGIITVTLPGTASFLPSGSTITLNPSGLRTAQLNGIIATSYGDQTGTPADTSPSGTVTVKTDQYSQINMSSDDPVLTAGISAAGAEGPGNADAVSANDRTVSVEHAGNITNSADKGVGIMATATGAEFSDKDATVATGGTVDVHLDGTGAISLTGTTGIGIFAVSEAYTLGDDPKGSTVAGGTVTITIDPATPPVAFAPTPGIFVGTASSTLSIGVLAVSTGTDGLLNPYSAQAVNKDGSGSGGTVTVTNNGTVQTAGKLSIGIAALSTGGAGIVTSTDSTSSGYSYLGNSGTSSQGSGDQVTVTIGTTGSVTTLGESAAGVVAISSGGGGIINNDLPGTSTGGLIVGDNNSSSSDPAANGGGVQVNENGKIQTGGGDGSGAASIGILAQSIGGSGGDAGGDKAALFVGDNGGGGGAGGGTTVDTGVGSTILTKDINSIGILAQSIGGGGGNGGNAKGLFVAVGGQGGKGGDGGATTLDLFGGITTEADHSAGVIAQSIGGGGGNGGSATSIGTIFDVAIGGKGATGGLGGTVLGTLEDGSQITTSGNNSAGMILQSVGGGGGNGGTAFAGSGNFLATATLALGGGGGGGGDGGAVTGTNDGTITTGIQAASGNVGLPNLDGADSNGVLIQSIGGGGGHGGSAMAKSLAVNPDPDIPVDVTFTLTFGGSGGKGSDGNTVNFTNTGAITTYSDASGGVVAQSVGGGGGDGGDATAQSLLLASDGIEASLVMTLGGQGGPGGNGNTVMVNNGTSRTDTTSDSISTYGQNSTGILAQSIGGGGGNGGLGSATAQTPTLGLETSAGTITLGLGGKSTNAGAGGVVDITNYGTVSTAGSGSEGIILQSIGGGGGKGGGGTSSASNNTLTVNVSVGGKGGGGGDAASQSTLYNWNSITTAGGDSTGIVAQSIGGGGGLATNESVFATGTITLGGTSSHVVGDGAATDLYGNGTVTTHGFGADAIVLQSIGGGGGVGGSGTNSTFSSVTPPDATVGGTGAQGKGGIVTVHNSLLNVTTSGDNAYGLVAQSIGGGGGLAAAYQGLAPGFGPSTGSGRLGGTGSDGNGGEVDITLAAGSTITTTGLAAHGLVVQSIGGGGGIDNPYAYSSANVGLTTSLATPNSGSTTGYGGNVNVTNNATIETSGAGAYGVILQTIGGGGGIYGDFAGSTGSASSSHDVLSNGTTMLTQNGSVTASGANSVGIFAQNVTSGTTGNYITLNINGAVSGGSGPNGYGVWVDGGQLNNTMTVSSTGSIIATHGSLSTPSGNAINYTGGGTLFAINNGTVTGSVNTGATGFLTNNNVFNAGSNITGVVENNALLNPGGAATLHSTFNSVLETSSGSTLKFDINTPDDYDQILFDNGAGSVDTQGLIIANFTDEGAVYGTHTFTLIGAGANTYFGDPILKLSLTGLDNPGYHYTYSYYIGSDESYNLVLTLVPEPGVAPLVLFGLTALWFCRKARIKVR